MDIDLKIVKFIGKYIAYLRKNHQMTQKQLAEKLKITVVSVGRLEANMEIPSDKIINKLKKIFCEWDNNISEILLESTKLSFKFPNAYKKINDLTNEIENLKNKIKWYEDFLIKMSKRCENE